MIQETMHLARRNCGGRSAINLRYSTAAGALKMAQRFWANTNLIDASPFDRIFSHCLFKPLYA